MIISYLIWFLSIFQSGIAGSYSARKITKDAGGSLQHVSSLKLEIDSTYQYTDVAFDSSGEIILADTIKGEWYTVGDTLLTKNYNVKWLIKRNSLIKLSVIKLKYRKEKR